MFFWGAKFKRFFIPQHSKYDVDQFTHDDTFHNFGFFRFNFLSIVIGQNGICGFFSLHWMYSRLCANIQNCSGIGRAALGDFGLGSNKFTRLSGRRVHAKERDKLLWLLE